MKLNNQPTINGKLAQYDIMEWSLDEYLDLIKIRQLPSYKVKGRSIEFDPSYIEGHLREQALTLPLVLTPQLFDYQQVISKVAYLKEKYAIFADAGLGKSYMLGELARQLHTHIDGKILFIIPLNILHQFEEMTLEFFPDFPEFVHLHNNRQMSLKEWALYDNVPRIGFVNHEAFIKDHSYLAQHVDCVLLDEASILKGGQGGNGKIAKHIISNTKNIRYKYAASATPAPNDKTEYAMIALFLEQIGSEKEFYANFFTVQGDDYILKRNAVKYFYRFLASWSIFIRDPKAYGFEDNLAGLSPWEEIYISIDMTPEQNEVIRRWATQGKQMLLPHTPIKPRSMAQRNKFSQVSKGFYYSGKKRDVISVTSNKPERIKEIVLSHSPEQVLIWTVFDAEASILEKTLSDTGLRIANISGKTKELDRIRLIDDFRKGKIDVMISKPEILGFGLNFQFCRIAIFSGLSDSYEKYYQAVKRIHRYGQKSQVLIYHIYTEYEYVILGNVMTKQKQAIQDFEYQELQYRNSLYSELSQFLERPEDYKVMKESKLQYEPVEERDYQLYHGDSLKILLEIGQGIRESYGNLRANSVDLSVFSPPFMGDLFTYSDDPADMGNTRGAGAKGGLDEFMIQFQFFLQGMYTVTKPGRLMAMHLEDVPYRKGLDGFIGIFDFVGRSIIQAEEAGWVLVAKIPILKNQQAQSIIKHISSLAMATMEKNRLNIAPCSNGYLLLFRKPGEAGIRVSDLYYCNECRSQGYGQEVENYQPNRKHILNIEPQCPTCGSNNIYYFSEFDGNKWIILAEGAWPSNGFSDSYDSVSKIPQNKRWYDWVLTALGIWPDIQETETLNIPFTKEEEDSDKHLCPLPLEVARRAIEMYTLPGELVFTPFLGIGTEAYTALLKNRQAVGIELKPEYFIQAAKNCAKAMAERQQLTLFDLNKLKVTV